MYIFSHLFRIGYDLPVGIPGTRAPDGQGPRERAGQARLSEKASEGGGESPFP